MVPMEVEDSVFVQLDRIGERRTYGEPSNLCL